MTQTQSAPWAQCEYLTCSVLPVRFACNCDCKFCFSKSSISALASERADWDALDVESYYRYAHERGARRLVITGGGEPLLRPDDVLSLVRRGRAFFDEIALFTNGTFMSRDLASALQASGLSYVCYSRHHHDEAKNRQLMGKSAPTLEEFFANSHGLRVRATCVMASGFVDDVEQAWAYVDALMAHGVREFTFKHTYVTYPRSVFRGSDADRWAHAHQVEFDPFEGVGEVVGSLPWGPRIRLVTRNGEECKLCHYREPTPTWELQNMIGRSLNLLSDGTVYGSLEDGQSLLFRLKPSREQSA